jgi:hypothetical protein
MRVSSFHNEHDTQGDDLIKIVVVGARRIPCCLHLSGKAIYENQIVEMNTFNRISS